MQRKRGVERISQDVAEIEVVQALTMGKSVRMHDYKGAELLSLGKKRTEFRIG